MDFKELSADNVPDDPIVLVNGKTRSGKSTTILHIFSLLARSQKHGGFRIVMVFCPSVAFRTAMSKFAPKAFFYEEWDESALKRLIDYQRTRANQGHPLRKVCFIEDDCLHDNAINNSKALSELLKVGRQYRITRILSVHNIADLKPKLREQSDMVVLPFVKFPQVLEKLYKEVAAGSFPDKKTFFKTFRKMTEHYGCMVLLLTVADSNGIEDEVFWIRPLHADIQVQQQLTDPVLAGSRNLFLVANTYYNPDVEADNTLRGAEGQTIRLVGEKEHQERARATTAALRAVGPPISFRPPLPPPPIPPRVPLPSQQPQKRKHSATTSMPPAAPAAPTEVAPATAASQSTKRRSADSTTQQPHTLHGRPPLRAPLSAPSIQTSNKPLTTPAAKQLLAQQQQESAAVVI